MSPRTSRILLYIAAGLSGLCLLSGCDFLRLSAGRPTSADLERMRVAVAASAPAAADVVADTTVVADTLSSEVAPAPSRETANLIKPDGTVLDYTQELAASPGHKFYVIVGTFCSEENLQRMVRVAELKGYEVEKIEFAGGLVAVGLCPTETPEEAHAALAKVAAEPFSPKDLYILRVE